jgi:hypothetical protein
MVSSRVVKHTEIHPSGNPPQQTSETNDKGVASAYGAANAITPFGKKNSESCFRPVSFWHKEGNWPEEQT